jgi:hypothetical protein
MDSSRYWLHGKWEHLMVSHPSRLLAAKELKVFPAVSAAVSQTVQAIADRWMTSEAIALR